MYPLKEIRMKKQTLITLSLLAFGFFSPAQADEYVKLYGGNQAAQVPTPASNSNPIPVSVQGTIAGTSITSTVNPSGVALANSTSTYAANSTITSAQTITLTAPSSNVTINNQSGGATIHVSFTGSAATVNSFPVFAGQALTFTGLPLVPSFSIIAESSSGNYGVLAH